MKAASNEAIWLTQDESGVLWYSWRITHGSTFDSYLAEVWMQTVVQVGENSCLVYDNEYGFVSNMNSTTGNIFAKTEVNFNKW